MKHKFVRRSLPSPLPLGQKVQRRRSRTTRVLPWTQTPLPLPHRHWNTGSRLRSPTLHGTLRPTTVDETHHSRPGIRGGEGPDHKEVHWTPNKRTKHRQEEELNRSTVKRGYGVREDLESSQKVARGPVLRTER